MDKLIVTPKCTDQNDIFGIFFNVVLWRVRTSKNFREI